MQYTIQYNPTNSLQDLYELNLQENDTVIFSYPNGLMTYTKYNNGIMAQHREDGPACFNINGPTTKIENGLVIETGHTEWWIDGECISYLVEDAMVAGKLNHDWQNWTASDKAKFKLIFT